MPGPSDRSPLLACLVLAVAAAALVAAAPAVAARTWDSPSIRLAGGEAIESPDVAFTSTGELLAIWYRSPPQPNAGLRFSARPPGGSFAAAAPIDPTAFQGSLAVDRRGGAFLAWRGNGSGLNVAHRAAGKPFGAAEVVDAEAWEVSIAAGAAGHAAVLFTRYEIGGRRLFTAFRPPGGTFGEAEPVSDQIPGETDPAAHVAVAPDGTAIYVWQQPTAGGLVVKGATRAASGAMGVAITLSRPGKYAHSPKVAFDGGGNAFATWVERDRRDVPGAVTVSHRPAGGTFGAPRSVGGFTSAAAIELGVSDPGEALIAYPSHSPAGSADNGGVPRPPQVVWGSTVSGALAAPRAWGDRAVSVVGLAMNPRGEALLWSRGMGWAGDVEVARRAPFTGFGGLQGVRCGHPASQVEGAALSPSGGGLLLSSKEYGPVEFSEDRQSAAGSLPCYRQPPAANPPRISRSKRLSLVARIPRGGKLIRGRWIEVLAQCNQACRLKVGGIVAVARRRRPLSLSPGSGELSRAGSRRIRVGLPRAGARLVRSRRARARIRVTARSAGGGSRGLTFRVQLRR